MSIFSYDKMILAMSHSSSAAALEPLVEDACGQSEYNFTERCRALCMALCLNPKEELCRMYIERCNHFIEDPPGEGWDGGWIMKTK